ncbi:hypothetical protein T492DRAFT_969449 [Pavlovales sp. CCMP2436]|nr:hypothetical protein T492DRAFT_969449 [Pavlovales sp. CCMP2436]
MCVARCGGRCCTRRRAARGDAAQGYQGYDDDAPSCGRRNAAQGYQGYDDDAASCGRRSVRARSVLAGTSRPPFSLGSSSGCSTRACGGRCCARRRATRGDAAQGYQGYDDDAAPCGRHGRTAAAEARPRRGARPRRSVGTGAHTLTPFGVSAGA